MKVRKKTLRARLTLEKKTGLAGGADIWMDETLRFPLDETNVINIKHIFSNKSHFCCTLYHEYKWHRITHIVTLYSGLLGMQQN